MSTDASAAPSTGLHADMRLRRDDFDLDVHLTVEPGETLALVGPNGAGKSTLVRLLSGLDALDDGIIELAGDVVDDPRRGVFVPPERRSVGVVFQDHLLFEHLSALDNVAFGPRARGRDRASAQRVASELLDRFGVADQADRRPSGLSGGQAQRVAIARALATDPTLLLLDEPLAALDVETRVAVRRLLRRHLDASDRPAVLISHDPADALSLGDRIAVIEAGRLTQVGRPDDVRRRPATPYVASLVGTNLLPGQAGHGEVVVGDDTDRIVLRIPDRDVTGVVRCTIRPEAISIHPDRPSGSQRNVWQTVVDTLESLGDTTRVTVGGPLPLAIDVTTAAVDALQLGPGASVWLAVKATEIGVEPD